MRSIPIPATTIPQGVVEYGPVVVPGRWDAARCTLDFSGITQQTWFTFKWSTDNGQTWATFMRLDIDGPGRDKQGNPLTTSSFSARFPEYAGPMRIKLEVDSPVAWSTIGGVIEVFEEGDAP